jgi:hypothetical protein
MSSSDGNYHPPRGDGEIGSPVVSQKRTNMVERFLVKLSGILIQRLSVHQVQQGVPAVEIALPHAS